MLNYHTTNIKKEKVFLDGDELHHLRRARRVKCGDTISVTDGKGWRYTVRIDRLGASEAQGTIVEKEFFELPLTSVTLAQSVPKGSRMDWLVEKVTELGVMRVIPMYTERSNFPPHAS